MNYHKGSRKSIIKFYLFCNLKSGPMNSADLMLDVIFLDQFKISGGHQSNPFHILRFPALETTNKFHISGVLIHSDRGKRLSNTIKSYILNFRIIIKS